VIQGCMRGIPEATPIILTADERAELEDLARSTKTSELLPQSVRLLRSVGRVAELEGVRPHMMAPPSRADVGNP
jgi:hypothetical protein